jgi:hypothetical protein
MPAPPLTHHEILATVAPFVRRGRRVDLDATDRVARRIAFRPLERPAADGLPALRETLELAHLEDGAWRIARGLEPEGGPGAELVATGRDPGALLAQVDAVAPSRQLVVRDGFALAMRHRLPAAPAAAEPEIQHGTIRTHGLELRLKVPPVSGISADLRIDRIDGGPESLPEDLLAVLGVGWSPIDRRGEGWVGHVGLRGRSRFRADAEAKLRAAAEHLARTLSEPPARFHERHARARWRVVARRAVPLAACIGLGAGAIALPGLGLARESVLWMLIFNSPPLLLVALFCMREMPRLELPRAPRVPARDAWRTTEDRCSPIR